MRIGIDARFYGGEQSKGLGRYAQKLIEYLAKHDNVNEYVIFLQQDGFDNWTIENPNFKPVLAPYNWYSVQEQIFMPIKILKEKVDFMHFPHFNVPVLYRGKFVVTIHDLILLRFPTERATTLGPFMYKLKHWAGQFVMRRAAKGSSHVITVSEFSKKDILEYYKIPDEKVTVTYAAAERDPNNCVGDGLQTVLETYGIEQPYMLYVGNAYPHKNLEILLDVAKQMKEEAKEAGKERADIQMVFVGKEDYFYGRLKQEFWARDLDDSVVFTGFVPDADLPCLYQGAYSYVFPSLYEGFGLPPLEAMSYGTPVIAAERSCLPEILGDAAVYFDPESISGIINAVKQFEDPAVRADFGERGVQQVRRYSWHNMMAQTKAVYEQQRQKKKTNS